MANTFKFGNKKWAVKKDYVLAYNDENNNFKPLPFDFTRDSTATYVDSDGLIKTAGEGIARIDYLDNTDGHLLLEPSRTNVINFSEPTSSETSASGITYEDFDWSLGFTNCIRFVDNSQNRYRYFSGTVANSTEYVISAFVIMDDLSEPVLGTSTGTGDFLLRVGGTSASTGNLPNVNMGNNIYRVSSKITSASGGGSTGLIKYTGQSSKGFRVVGFQVEEGSYATSYIPTSGTSVTRAVDAASQTPPSGIIGQTEGTLFIDFVPLNDPESGIGKWMFFLGNGTSYITILLSSNGKIRGGVSNTTSQCAIDTTYDWQNGVRYKAAFAYKENDFAMYVNGSLIGTDVSGTIPSTSLITTQYNTTPANANNYLLNNAVLYNTRLPNAELATLTT